MTGSVPNLTNGGAYQVSDANLANSIVFRDSSGNVAVGALTANTVITKALNRTVTAISTAYTATAADGVIIESGSSGSVTVTLPPASTSNGMMLTVMRTSASNSVVVDGNASETINGAATKTITTQYGCVHIYCDGTQWLMFGHEGTIT